MRNFVLGLFIAGCFSAQAASLTYDFRDVAGATPSTSAGGSNYGNSITFTTGGVSVRATAWSLTGGINDDTFENAYLGRYDTGLGVCNRDEYCTDPAHQVDNDGRRDFVLFQFSAPVIPMTVTIDPYGSYDRDVTYYSGTAANPLDLTGKSLSTLNTVGFGSATNDDSTVSGNARTVTLSAGATNSLLFGARVGAGADNYADYFKISGLTASTVATPEPATLGISGLAFLGLGLIRRFRRAKA